MYMKNIELKLQIDTFGGIVNALKRLRAKHKGKFLQTDTYYNCPNGRFKIRENNGNDFEIIFYQRPDKKASKVSFYLVSKIEKSQLKKEKNIFKEALGEKVVVKKQRDLWLYKNTRVHLDKVSGLGNYLELETEVEKAGKNAKKEHNKIINLLNLSKYKTCDKSYSDMVLR